MNNVNKIFFIKPPKLKINTFEKFVRFALKF